MFRLVLFLVLIFCFPPSRLQAQPRESRSAGATSAPAGVERLIRQGDEALEAVTEDNAAKAAAEYETALRLDPQNYEANWKAARAYCLILDFKTRILLTEKDEDKPALRELGEKAEAFGARAYAANPRGLDALVWYTGSIAYHAAGTGILKAIYQGTDGKIESLAAQLISLDPVYHGAFGYRILGRLYLKAPFPKGNKRKAAEYLEKAVAAYPPDLQNHYWLGAAYLSRKKFPEAQRQFQYVLDHPPQEIEAHFSGLLKDAARLALDSLPPR